MTIPCTRCNGTGQEPDWQKIGAEVKRRREAKGWSTRELAEMAGCSHQHVSNIENGGGSGGLGGAKTSRLMALLGITETPDAD